MAARSGAITVQVNPHHTEIDDAVSFLLKGAAGKILPELVAEIWGLGTAPVGGTDA
jgi:NAD-dependent SIR2 family protein deacetylase